jgi:hypothetical protein
VHVARQWNRMQHPAAPVGVLERALRHLDCLCARSHHLFSSSSPHLTSPDFTSHHLTAQRCAAPPFIPPHLSSPRTAARVCGMTVIGISVALYQLQSANSRHPRPRTCACTHSNTTPDSIMLPAPTTSSAYLTRGGGKRRINDPPPLFALSRSERVGTSARAYMRERSRTRTPPP